MSSSKNLTQLNGYADRAVGLAESGLLLLDGLDRLGPNLLVLDLRGTPPTAQRFDQIDRQHHLLAEELGR